MDRIMKNKSKLKNLEPEKVYINDDLTKKERAKQKKMSNFARDEKSKGKNVKMRYNNCHSGW